MLGDSLFGCRLFFQEIVDVLELLRGELDGGGLPLEFHRDLCFESVDGVHFFFLRLRLLL